MAEEQDGFTFVDKRRAAVDETAQAVIAVMDAASAESVTEELPVEEGREAGDEAEVYGIIGYCISLLSSTAWQKMGLMADPQTGEAKSDLVQAKVAVDAAGDLAAYLDSAPEDAIPAEMRRELRTLMNDLRLNYVAQHGSQSV